MMQLYSWVLDLVKFSSMSTPAIAPLSYLSMAISFLRAVSRVTVISVIFHKIQPFTRWRQGRPPLVLLLVHLLHPLLIRLQRSLRLHHPASYQRHPLLLLLLPHLLLSVLRPCLPPLPLSHLHLSLRLCPRVIIHFSLVLYAPTTRTL